MKPDPTSSVAAAAANTKMRHAAIWAVLLIVFGAAAGLLPRWRHRAELQATTRELAVQTVSVIAPVPGKAAPGLNLPAEIKPQSDAAIYARASGYVKRFLVDLGAQVKAGDLLAEIDTPELNQELAQARAQLAQAQAVLALSKTTAARWAELLKTASVSEQDAAEKAADLELQSANVEAARANVRRLEEVRAFQHVLAPFAGVITARGVDVGQLVTAGSGHELFHLVEITTLRVFVRVPESTAATIAIGQVAALSLSEQPGKTFPATVVRTAGAISADSRTLLTELAVDNADGRILSGSFAQVRFPQARQEAALTLPANTLLFRAEGPQVGVVDAEGKVQLRSVTIGRDFGTTLEALAGVTAADRIILNPSDSLMSGVVVRVAQAPGTSEAGKR